VAISHILIYQLSKRIFDDKRFFLLPNLFFSFWHPFFEGYVLWIDSFVAPLLLLAAIATVEFEKKRDAKFIFFIGFILGTTLVIKQVTFPLIFLFCLYLWLKFRRVSYFISLACGLLLPILYLAYFVVDRGIVEDFWFWTIVFNLTTFSQMGRKLIRTTEMVKISFPFLIALAYSLYVLAEERAPLKNKVMPVAVFFLGGLFFAYARFDFVHLQPSLPFAVVILALIIFRFRKHKLRGFASVATTAGIFAIIALFIYYGYVKLLTSEVSFYGAQEMNVARLVNAFADSGQSVFAFGSTPHIYQMTHTRPAGNLFVFQFPWFMKVAETRILEGLISDPPKVIIRDRFAEVAGINLTKYSSEIDKYVDRYYHVVENVNNVEILIPN
jgi:hypothetical protein